MKINNLRTKTAVLSLIAVFGIFGTFATAAYGTKSSTADQVRNREDRLERVADRIERALERDSELRRYNLDADEENGRYIELEGTVRTRAERNRAYQIARDTAPRVRIVNKIRVSRR